jgi:hypothetical protein
MQFCARNQNTRKAAQLRGAAEPQNERQRFCTGSLRNALAEHAFDSPTQEATQGAASAAM